MDYRQLRAFIAVFEERNITAAAQRLHLTQPALSGSIKLLEDALGTCLFLRKARGVEVTDNARSLYPQARRMLAEAEQLTTRFRAQPVRERLVVGIEQDVARTSIQQLVIAAHACLPGLQLDLVAACDGDARLGCEDLRCEDELFLPILSEHYVLAMPATGRWAEQPFTHLSEIDGLPAWIMCPHHASHQRLMPMYGMAANRPAAYASNFSLALDLVASGVGIAVVPQSLAQETAGVVMRQLDTLDLRRRIGICYSIQSLEVHALTLLRNAMGKL